MKMIPCGFQVLIEMEKVERVSAGGIITHTNTEFQREQNGHDVGRIIAFGPLAFVGFDCSTPEEWGVKIGDLVEFRRYDGKIPRHDDEIKYRCINDSDILMVIESEEQDAT